MNTSQAGAVCSQNDWNLVLAGPGSGKTTVIVKRAHHLVSRGVHASQMAFVTFTQVGAKVLRRRLNLPGAYVGTLHSMLLSQLRKHDPKLVMISEEDADEFLRVHAQRVGYKGSASELMAAKRGVLKPEDKSEAARAVRSYQQFMRQ
jgi:superfamily I DNA/RNA helicase